MRKGNKFKDQGGRNPKKNVFIHRDSTKRNVDDARALLEAATSKLNQVYDH